MHARIATTSLTFALGLALVAGTSVHAAANDAPAASPAATIAVSNCNDSGAGSLRAAVAAAASGDTINMRSLECRDLVLTSGAIQVPQDDLTVLGPTRALTIDGNQADRVFQHTGTGTLRLRAMSIAFGRYEGSHASGACINSPNGNLRLEYVRVHDCDLIEQDDRVATGGGGMFGNEIALYNSEVFNNDAGVGGGIWAEGHLTLVRSRITNNRAGSSGGFEALGGLYVRSSEISDNYAGYSFGAFFGEGGDLIVIDSLIAGNYSGTWFIVALVDPSILVANTTISGNRTGGNFSGLMMESTEGASVVNSTIVNNVEELSTINRGCQSPVVSSIASLHLESSIVARNTCDGRSVDIAGGEVVGSDNLVLAPLVPVPPDTISANPRISPLADNGGHTRTHALWAGSPAVDMGNNNAGLSYDQRGPGFDRVKGGRADIGAFER